MKKIIISLAALTIAVAAMTTMLSRSVSDSLFDANVEALAYGESELGSKCGGCSTDKSIYCCTLVVIDLGTFYLYKD